MYLMAVNMNGKTEKIINNKEIVQKKDFVELKFTGYANGIVFDSNIEDDLKKLHPEAKPKELVIIVGENMVVPGFDNALEGKEINKDYEIKLSAKDGFGERKRELMKTIPLNVFRQQKIEPRAGMMLTLDNFLVKIITVSGARVVTDFNNPLAGKEIVYKFKIIRKLTDEKEKVEVLFSYLFNAIPEFEIKDKEIAVKGPKELEGFVNDFKDKFKSILGKELKFEEKDAKITV